MTFKSQILMAFLILILAGASSCSEESHQQQPWFSYLPKCPCQNPDLHGVVLNDNWAKDKGDLETYHTGASECFRSYPYVKTPAGHSGQQCCYDQQGDLITRGSGAGTPDKESSCDGEDVNGVMTIYFSNIPFHYMKDVKPYTDLGGKDKAWPTYNRYWPPNNGNRCWDNTVIR